MVLYDANARWPTETSARRRVGRTNARGGGGGRGSSSDSVSSRDSSRRPANRFRPPVPASSAGGAGTRPNHSRARREDGQAAPGPRVPSDGDGKSLPRKKTASNRQVPSLADFLSAEQLALLLRHPGVSLNSQPLVDPPAVVVAANNSVAADVVSNNAGTSAALGLSTPPAAVVYDHASIFCRCWLDQRWHLSRHLAPPCCFSTHTGSYSLCADAFVQPFGFFSRFRRPSNSAC